jgi:hypothetical protein
MVFGKRTRDNDHIWSKIVVKVKRENEKKYDDYHLPEDDNHHSHRRGNLKSYMKINKLQCGRNSIL